MQDDFSNFDDWALANNLIPVVRQFVSTLNERAGKQHAAKVIFGKSTLDGSRIEQEPERFIEDELIEPIMEVLGYDCRFRPKGFEGLNGRIPDFTALNLAATNLGEVKVPGKITDAREESVEYLEMAEGRPLIGFATDGFVWILYTATEPNERPRYTHHATLNELVRKIRMEQTQPKRESIPQTHLRELSYKFASEFNADYVKQLL